MNPYQGVAGKLFQENVQKIDWLIKWRKLFGVEIGSRGDQTLAYLIQKVFEEKP